MASAWRRSGSRCADDVIGAVRDRLAPLERRVDLPAIEVTVECGTVVLRGVVGARWVARELEHAARRAARPAAVVSHLRVSDLMYPSEGPRSGRPGVRGSLSGATARVRLRHTILDRYVATVTSPTNRGRRGRSLLRAARFDLWTRYLGRPTVAVLGRSSTIVAYPGETNSPHAVYRNPPNWPEMVVWRERLQPGDLFVDVGANIGLYTIFATELGATVIAVEPNACNAARIHEHLWRNGRTAEVVQKALADEVGGARITDDLDSYNHLLVDGRSGGVQVECTTLDDLLGDRVAAGVKIDVEGSERRVLLGAERALAAQRIRLLQIEWTAREARVNFDEDREPVAELLRRHGYALHRPDEGGVLRLISGVVSTGRDVFAVPRGEDADE